MHDKEDVSIIIYLFLIQVVNFITYASIILCLFQVIFLLASSNIIHKLWSYVNKRLLF
jgi:hypothetical protein